ncbi:hypothetical protein [Streptomyces sp. Wb2n-11]|uniref:hypothetical protein n=1 Tax=Streptomyces sp. Wb2n-11 TaxID=1030533 RepID=UPI000AB12A11|nr:hypothetical protein [Streptomyces sp. Wb2n-11]
MSMAMERTLAAPDLLKAALHFLPDWLRAALGAAVLLLLLVTGARGLRRAAAVRRLRPRRPAH